MKRILITILLSFMFTGVVNAQAYDYDLKLYVPDYNVIDRKEPRNVLDYGATGNGITDDTEAIQSAMNRGGEVYFPSGTYRISKTLTYKKPVELIGAHSRSTILMASENICILDMWNADGNSRIENLRFTRDSATTNKSEVTGIGAGFPFQVSHHIFRNLFFDDLGVGIDGYYGDAVIGLVDSMLESITFYNCEFAMKIDESCNNVMQSFFMENDYAIYMSQRDKVHAPGLFMYGSVFVQNKRDIYIEENVKARNIIINSSWFEQTTESVISTGENVSLYYPMAIRDSTVEVVENNYTLDFGNIVNGQVVVENVGFYGFSDNIVNENSNTILENNTIYNGEWIYDNN